MCFAGSEPDPSRTSTEEGHKFAGASVRVSSTNSNGSVTETGPVITCDKEGVKSFAGLLVQPPLRLEGTRTLEKHTVTCGSRNDSNDDHSKTSVNPTHCSPSERRARHQIAADAGSRKRLAQHVATRQGFSHGTAHVWSNLRRLSSPSVC
jgi:hypothetical protein